ncbi:MAG: indole-3-glycerol phosphate synthase TrpC [Clostridiales bacterium]|nr:indole-3-glycerol phosphate synthase TrpC [Clostridiales bacterium]
MILDKIAESTVKRVNQAKEKQILEILQEKIYFGSSLKRFNNRPLFAFENALKAGRNENTAGSKTDGRAIHFICEVKKASPSKGVISPDFPYMEIARDYAEAGASAISVLTEPEFFQGSDRYLHEISKAVDIPVLRKDFILDEYQIYESKIIGADAVLLICALLDKERTRKFIKICDELGMSALVEAHTEEEIDMALEAGARIIGVNNRNLKTFEVDLETCIRLRKHVPGNIVYVAESGIHTRDDVKRLEAEGIDAVLIGEAFMKSKNRRQLLKTLRTG